MLFGQTVCAKFSSFLNVYMTKETPYLSLNWTTNRFITKYGLKIELELTAGP